MASDTEARNRFNNELGKRLKVVREHYGLSQREWATVLGVTKSALEKWESGDTTAYPHILVRIALVAVIPLDFLITGKVSPIREDRIAALHNAFPEMRDVASEPSEDDWLAVKAIRGTS